MSDTERIAYSVSEVAERLGVSTSTVRDEINAGRLASFRLGDRVLIPKAAIDAMIERAIVAASPQPARKKAKRPGGSPRPYSPEEDEDDIVRLADRFG